ncbi:kinesin-like protein [Plakobranchus ocellatus]|uniref:Kinesin-like protein n=1 Tax=Plakobranchus ocellatus TaxID=259542 RepID=A0AAV4E518_9GAST|nr:kinesin-like protein [Plakobranchus ocellatus]
MTMFHENPGTCKSKGNANLRVVVRLRPVNEAEHNEKYRTVTHAISDHVLVFDPKIQSVPGVLQSKPRDVNRHRFKDLKYAFDHVFGPCATNRDVFEHATKGIVNGVLNGYNCSVFAYGATGAGKTHTMLGSECEPGVIYFTMMDLYRRIEEQRSDKIFDVAVSYSEVYNEQVRDLLVPRGNLPIREDKTVGVIIAGLSLHKPKTAEELLHMLHFGNKNRTQHPTDANAESSRSHAVFQVFVNQRDKLDNMNSEVVMAKMCLVDLAGSERAHHTTNCGVRFREGANINRSLLALGNVINALADNKNEELRKTKQRLLESLDKAETGSGQNISPIMRQLQERLKDLFKVRRDIRKVQMESEGAKRELKWKVSRRELAIKRVQQLTCSSSVLSKHSRVIERMKKRIDKEEESLRQSTLRMQDQDNAIRKAFSEFSASDCRQTPELLDLNARTHILESNLYDSDMYLAFVKKLARAQERQACVTESLVMSLLQLVKKQHDVLHSQDLLSPELQHKYEQCCYLVEERGVSFSQQPLPSPLPLQHAKDCRDSGTSPSDEAAVASTDEWNNLNISDIIDIQIPRLRVQGLIQHLTQGKRPEPQRVVRPVSAVRPAARVALTQEGAALNSPATTQQQQQPTSTTGLTHQGTFSKPNSSSGLPGRVTISTNPAQQLNYPVDVCSTHERRTCNSQFSHGHGETPQGPLFVSNPGSNAPSSLTPASAAGQVTSSTHHHHHHFQVCAAPNLVSAPQRVQSSSPSPTSPLAECGQPTCSQPMGPTDSAVSLEANSSTENLNNTFQVLQPALPNTPCIDAVSYNQNHHQNYTPQRAAVPPPLQDSTPCGKRLQSNFSQNKLTFQSTVGEGEPHPYNRSMLGQGDGQSTEHRTQLYKAGFETNNMNSNASIRQVQNMSCDTDAVSASNLSAPPAASNAKCTRLPVPTPFKCKANQSDGCKASSPPSHTLSQRPSSTSSSLQADNHPSQCPDVSSSSPKTYAEALKSPPVRRLSVKTPVSSKPPARVKVDSSASTKEAFKPTSLVTPVLSLSQLKRRLQLSCEKLPVRVEVVKPGERSSRSSRVRIPILSSPISRLHTEQNIFYLFLSDYGAIRQPLRPLDYNNKETLQNTSGFRSSSTSSTASSSVLAKCDLSQQSQNFNNQTSLKLKARPLRRNQRAMGASKPYSIQKARRQNWPSSRGSQDLTGGIPGRADAANAALPERPSYMQPTFARAQKMLGLDQDKSSLQRQAENPPLSRRTLLHKQRL